MYILKVVFMIEWMTSIYVDLRSWEINCLFCMRIWLLCWTSHVNQNRETCFDHKCCSFDSHCRFVYLLAKVHLTTFQVWKLWNRLSEIHRLFIRSDKSVCKPSGNNTRALKWVLILKQMNRYNERAPTSYQNLSTIHVDLLSQSIFYKRIWMF